jgi:hypothetical protein
MERFFLIILLATLIAPANAGSFSKEWVECVGGSRRYIISWAGAWSSNTINMYTWPSGADHGTNALTWNFEMGNLGSAGCTTRTYSSTQFAMFATLSNGSEKRDARLNVKRRACREQLR